MVAVRAQNQLRAPRHGGRGARSREIPGARLERRSQAARPATALTGGDMRNQLIAVLAALCTSGAFAHEEDAGKGQLGKVNFANSCSPKVQQNISRAVAMLHSFWWPAGQSTFQEIASEDPNCVVAAWGFASILMYNPFVGGTPPNDVARAQAAIDKGRQMGAKTQREKDYLE